MSHAARPGNRSVSQTDHVSDLKLAASKMLGAKRRAFQAQMAVKYCAGSPRQAEVVFGWSRDAVELGLHEQRTGMACLSAQSVVAGDKLWEEKHPEVANALWALAQAHSQQDPTFRTQLSFTRLSAKEARKDRGRVVKSSISKFCWLCCILIGNSTPSTCSSMKYRSWELRYSVLREWPGSINHDSLRPHSEPPSRTEDQTDWIVAGPGIRRSARTKKFFYVHGRPQKQRRERSELDGPAVAATLEPYPKGTGEKSRY